MIPPRCYYSGFLGTGSDVLRLFGCAQPATGYMGSKRVLAPDILAAEGLRSGLGAEAVVGTDAGPWGRTWQTILGERGGEVADLLDQWAQDYDGRDDRPDPFDLWHELAGAPAPDDDVEYAAAYLWCQARSASTTPVWWPEDGMAPAANGAESLTQASRTSRTTDGTRGHAPWHEHPEKWRPTLRQASSPQRGAVERDQPAWMMGANQPHASATSGGGVLLMSGAGGRSPSGKLYAAGSVRPATTRLAKHKGTVTGLKGTTDGGRDDGLRMAEKRARGRREKGAVERSRTHSGRCNGVQTPATIARRVRVIRSLRWPRTLITRRHLTADELAEWLGTPGDLSGVVVYLDPPYQDCTPYAVDCPREDVVAMALDFARLGALVCVSEAVALPELLALGWYSLDITIPGKKPEWLTLNRRPAVVRGRQIDFLGAA